MRLAVDAMGGDFAPVEIVKGAIQAARELGVAIVLTGPVKEVEKEITFRSYYTNRTYTPNFLKEKMSDKKKQNTLFDTPLF